MWTRSELKEKAKIAFKRNYWKCVLAALIVTFLTGTGSSTAGTSVSEFVSGTAYEDEYDYYDDYEAEYYEDEYYDEYYEDEYYDEGALLEEILNDDEFTSTFIVAATIIIIIVLVVVFIVSVFVCAPFEVGGCRFFIENSYGTVNVKKVLFAFRKKTYWKTVATLFLRNLYTALWSLLLIVPGVVKSYEYRMIPYLLADDPNMPREDAFRISKEMMYGEKMNAFVLDMSFIGWVLLSTITCGVAGLFYVTPYKRATDAELFLTLRDNYFRKCQTTDRQTQSPEFQNDDTQDQQFQNQEL